MRILLENSWRDLILKFAGLAKKAFSTKQERTLNSVSSSLDTVTAYRSKSASVRNPISFKGCNVRRRRSVSLRDVGSVIPTPRIWPRFILFFESVLDLRFGNQSESMGFRRLNNQGIRK